MNIGYSLNMGMLCSENGISFFVKHVRQNIGDFVGRFSVQSYSFFAQLSDDVRRNDQFVVFD